VPYEEQLQYYNRFFKEYLEKEKLATFKAKPKKDQQEEL